MVICLLFVALSSPYYLITCTLWHFVKWQDYACNVSAQCLVHKIACLYQAPTMCYSAGKLSINRRLLFTIYWQPPNHLVTSLHNLPSYSHDVLHVSKPSVRASLCLCRICNTAPYAFVMCWWFCVWVKQWYCLGRWWRRSWWWQWRLVVYIFCLWPC